MGHLKVATDNFNRANSANLGSNWSTGVFGTPPGILSNQAVNPTGSANLDAFWSNDPFTPNQYVIGQNIQRDTGSVDDFSGVTVRASATDHIAFVINQNAGNVHIEWYNAGAFTILASDGGATGDPNGKEFMLEVVGFTLRAYLNRTLILTVTDPRIPIIGSPGLKTSSTTANQDIWDNWEGGNIVDTSRIAGINGGKLLKPRPFAPGLAR